MAEAKVIKCEMKHIEDMYGRIASADQDEVRALGFSNPNDALMLCYRQSWAAWAGICEDRVVCCFGVAPKKSLISKVGVPWLLNSDLSRKHIVKFSRDSLKYINIMLQYYDRLENFVDSRHRICLRWLKWCGFKLEEAEPMGPYGILFHPFWKER